MADETILNSEEILSEIAANSPDIVLPSGYLCQRSPAAILQAKDDSAMSATFAIVTRSATPNRYGNQLQLLPNANGVGPVTDYYGQNPVVLYDHGMGGLTLPVGLSKTKDGPLAMAFSATQGIATCYFSKQSWAEPIYAAVSEGLLKMASIGFDPMLAMRLKPAGPQQAVGQDGVQDLTWLGMDFTQWELLEWSIVPIGADRGALRQCLDRGKIHDIKLPNFLKQSFSKHAATVQKLGIGMAASKGVDEEADDDAPDDTQASPKCDKCGNKLQCVQCMKQSEKEPDPDIAPDTSMAYPPAEAIAQACAAQINQSQLKGIEQGVLNGVKQAVQSALTPIAKNVAALATEFQRMTGKLND